jgi:glycosyltransferase involved in cell wall biosynthesis
MGVPVVVNQGIGDIDGFIRRCSVGVVVDDFRKENYRKAVLQLMDILKDKDSLAERCRKLAANEFSLESAVRKYNEIYRSAG